MTQFACLNLDIGNGFVDWLMIEESGKERQGKVKDFSLLESQLVSVEIGQVRMACVRRDQRERWLRLIYEKWQLHAQLAKVRREPLDLAYKEPQQLGIDRWLALLAPLS